MVVMDGYNSAHKDKHRYNIYYREKKICRITAINKTTATRDAEEKTGINSAFLQVEELA